MQMFKLLIGCLWIMCNSNEVSIAQMPGTHGSAVSRRQPIRFYRPTWTHVPLRKVIVERHKAPRQPISLPTYHVPHVPRSFHPPQVSLVRPLSTYHSAQNFAPKPAFSFPPRHVFWFRPENKNHRFSVQHSRSRPLFAPPVPQPPKLHFNPIPVAQVPFPVAQVPSPVPQVRFPVPQVPFPVPQVPFPVPQVPFPVPQVPFPVRQVPSPVPQVPFPAAQVPFPAAQVPFPVAQTPVRVAQTPVRVAQTPVRVAQTPVLVAQTPVRVAQTPVRVAQTPLQVLPASPPRVRGFRSSNARTARARFIRPIVSRSPRMALGRAVSVDASTNNPKLLEQALTNDIGDELPRELPITEADDLDAVESQRNLSLKQQHTKVNDNDETYREEVCGSEQSCRSAYQCAVVGGRPTFFPCGSSSTLFCCDLSSEALLDSTRNSNVKSDPQCGWSREKTSRIVGSHDTEFGEIPWQAFVQVGDGKCGGALLSRRHVVTAAHCVNGKTEDDIEVLLGELVLNRMIEELPHEHRRVAKLIIHPGYKDLNLDSHDVAILVLDEPVEYQPNIMPICLPEPEESFTGALATVSGWGRLYADHVVKSSHLQSVQVPIIENTLCREWLRSRGKFAGVRSDHVCAGYERGGKDACRGDSGGPLTYEKNGRWFLVGLVSAGFSCGKPKQPGIYHRVSSSVEWISNMISNG